MKTLPNKFILLTLVILFTSVSFAQKKEVEKANKEFDKFAYIDAREIYLKVVEDGYTSAQIFKNLGDTYYWNSDYDNAAKWYQRLVNEFPNEAEAMYYYRAAQSLKSLGQDEVADELMEAYIRKGGDPKIIQATNTSFLEYEVELQKVSVNTDNSDFGSAFYGNKLVYASATIQTEGDKIHEWNQQPFLDLFEADMDENGMLSNPTKLNGEVNTRFHESSAVFTKDGNTMYFTRNNFIDGKKGRDKEKTIRLKLYKATKNSETYWTNIEELPFNSKEYSVAHPALSLDEKKLYFSSDMPGTTGMSDIWYVDILEDGTYGTPMNVSALNTEARESFPFISENNNLYFASDGRGGLGGYDVFMVPMGDDGMPDGEIKNLGAPTNSNKDDFGFILNERKRIGYVSSNRDGEKGSVADEIYRVQERCEVTIAGTITSNVNNGPVANATVTLLDENSIVVKTMTADANGRYSFDNLAECSSVYIVRAIGDGCEYNEKLVTTPSASGTVMADLVLECDPCPPNDLGCRLKLEPIYFDFDRYNIRPDAEIELAKILAAMRQYPELIIHIESHTDSRGNDAYNEALSEKRAQSTLEWLVSKGIDRNRLSARGYGEYQLTNQCSNGVECTEEEHQLNRRSMFIIQN
ncbi:MAG: flagellar motor protein MotB [Flavobacterium sp.]|nr:MAG: flagellar motor protein MotB [Flavobacterium sp.]